MMTAVFSRLKAGMLLYLSKEKIFNFPPKICLLSKRHRKKFKLWSH